MALSVFLFPQQAAQKESFKQAQKNYKLSDDDLLLEQKALLRLSILMVTVAVLILGYTGYQLFYGTLRAALLSFIVMMIALVLAFRYHFWYFQIKNRKLVVPFKQWYRQGLLGEKK